MITHVVRNIPIERRDGRYFAHAQVDLTRSPATVTILGVTLPSGTLTLSGPSVLLHHEMDAVEIAALEATLKVLTEETN